MTFWILWSSLGRDDETTADGAEKLWDNGAQGVRRDRIEQQSAAAEAIAVADTAEKAKNESDGLVSGGRSDGFGRASTS
jgi:hypothetical protein